MAKIEVKKYRVINDMIAGTITRAIVGVAGLMLLGYFLFVWL